jgi:hypothetical protein
MAYIMCIHIIYVWKQLTNQKTRATRLSGSRNQNINNKNTKISDLPTYTSSLHTSKFKKVWRQYEL